MIHDDNFFDFLNKTTERSEIIRKNAIKNKAKRATKKTGFSFPENVNAKFRIPVETTCGTLRFSGASLAAQALGKTPSAVHNAIRSKSRCGGYYWQYVKKTKE
jgi:hypothetical protein